VIPAAAGYMSLFPVTHESSFILFFITLFDTWYKSNLVYTKVKVDDYNDKNYLVTILAHFMVCNLFIYFL
jgi:hypothetical protein